MTKRLLSILLVCVILTTLFPTQIAFASESAYPTVQETQDWTGTLSWEDAVESLDNASSAGNGPGMWDTDSLDSTEDHTVIVQPTETEDGVFDIVPSVQDLPSNAPIQDGDTFVINTENLEQYGVPEGGSGVLFATDITSGNYTYTLSGEAATITGYIGADSELSIPASIDGYPVIAIGTSAFEGNTTLIHVIVPEGITEIGETAFKNCTALLDIDLPSTLTSFKAGAFESCTSLASIEIPAALDTVYHYTSSHNGPFAYCSSLKTAIFEDGAPYVKNHLFAGCTGLETIVLPDSMTAIGSYAFYGCSALTNAVISDNITSLGFKCFANCKSLININIPRSWSECPSSSTSTVNADYCGHIFEGCSSLTEVTVPEGMSELPSYAFNYCDYLETVNLPSVLSAIKNHTFYRCSRLRNVAIPTGVTTIGKSAFCYCAALENIIIPDGVTEIALYAFNGCTSLQKAFLPDSVISIGYQCFADCSSLTEINIPRNWSECPSDNGSTINTDHCGHIFQGCKSLTEITIPEGMIIPSYGLCYSDYLVTVHMPTTGTQINNHTFYGCSRLESISIPQGVSSIGKSAFCYCNSLRNISLPDDLTALALYAFNGCSSLENIHLPDTITSIGWQCFADCSSLVNINLPLNWSDCPSSNTSGTISTDYCGHIFQGCKNLNTLTVPDGLTVPSYGLCYSDYVETVSLPENAAEIKNHTFYGCAMLKNINIPETVTYIGKSAFNQCSSLETISIPSGIREIISYTFYQCSGLKKIDIPDTVENIYEYAFDGCKLLKEVTIPDSVTGIGYHAFANCVNLTDVRLSRNWNICLSTNSSYSGTSYQGGIFNGCTSLLSVTVPDGVTALPAYAFSNCNNLKSVRLPDSLTAIPQYAFYGCSQLLLIQIPSGVSSISDYAFYGCSAAQMINIADSLQVVGNYAFYNCSNSATVNYAGGADAWSGITFGQRGNTSITNTTPNCDYSFDATFGLVRPTSLGNCFYSSPEGISFSNFYGGYCHSSGQSTIDVNDAFFGLDAYDLFVSIPKDSYVTLRFPHIIYFGNDSYLYLKTTGIVNERADFYAVMEDGSLQFMFTAVEDSEAHTIPLRSSGGGVIGLKIVGKDLDGDSPGFDVVDVYLMAHETAVEADYNSKTSVSMTRNRTTYNLLKEEQAFMQRSDELVTVIVTPDWQNYNPGRIVITQHGNTILQSQGGAFVDIKPGILFAPSESIFISLYDDSGNIVESLRIKLKINPIEAAPIASTVPSGKYQFHVVDQNGVSLSGATVSWDNKIDQTDSDGLVSFDLFTVGTPVVRAELDGYLSWTNSNSNWSKASSRYETIILYPAALGQYKLTSCRYSNSSLMTFDTDLLTTTKTVSLGNDLPLAGNLDFGAFYVSCGTSAPLNAVDHYELWQGKSKIAEESSGFFTLSADSFKDGGGCFIRVVSASNDSVDTHINLQFKTQKVNKATEISLNGKSFSFKVGDDIPFIGGNTFNYKLPLRFPVTYLQTEDKIQLGLNVNVVGDKTTKEQLKDARDLIRKAKRAGSMKLGKLSAQDEKIFKSLIKGKNGFEFFKGGEINVLGYLEADFGSNTAKGHIMLQGKINPVQFGYTAWVVVVPVTANIELGLEAGLIGEVSYDWANAVLLGTLDFEASAKLTAFGGVGIGKFVGAGAYGSAELEGLIRILATPNTPTGLQKVELTGELGLKAYLGPKTWNRPFAYNTWTLYTANNVRLFSEGENWRTGIYNAESYQAHDLSYLAGESEWICAPAMLYDATASTTLTPLLTETYRNAQPVMAAGPNGIYAAFLRADAVSGQVYAVTTKYNGSAWTEPVRVDNTAVLDDAPSLCVGADGTIWLSYARTEYGFDADSLTDYAKKQTIVVGTLNPDTLAFTKVKEYAGSGYAHLQRLELINGTPTLAWVDSVVTDDDSVLWPMSGSIYTASCVGNAWGNAAQAVTIDKPVHQLIIGENDGALALAYTVDVDGDFNTTEDISLYCNGVLLSADVQGRVTFGQIAGMAKPEFLWNGDGCLESASGEQIAADGISSEYVLANDRIYYSAADGMGAHLTVVLYDNGNWNTPITLSGGERYLENLSVVSWNSGSYLLGMDTFATIAETSVTDSKNLVWAVIMPSSDLRLDDISYELDDMVPGERISITLTVTNAGDHAVTAIDVSQDGGGSETVVCSLLPGESIDIVRTVICPTTLTEYTFSVHESGMNDFTPHDNAATVSLGYAILSVRLEEQRIGSSQALHVLVTNNGIDSASGSVRFSSEDGTILDEIAFESLASGDSAVILYPGNFDNGDYTVTLLYDSENLIAQNESDTIHIERSSEIQSVTLEGTTVHATVSAGKGGVAYCAAYDASKKQIGIRAFVVTAGTQEIEFTFSSLEAADTIRVFLVDEDAIPQCEAENI